MAELKSLDGRLLIDGRPVIKAWESFSGWYWFAVEKVREQVSEIKGDAVPDTIWFGLVQGFEEEWGDFSEAELRSMSPEVWEIPARDLPHSGRRTG